MKYLHLVIIMALSLVTGLIVMEDGHRQDLETVKKIGVGTVVSVGHPNKWGEVYGMVKTEKYVFEYELGKAGYYQVGSKIQITRPPSGMSSFQKTTPLVFLLMIIIPALCFVSMTCFSISEH